MYAIIYGYIKQNKNWQNDAILRCLPKISQNIGGMYDYVGCLMLVGGGCYFVVCFSCTLC